MTPYHPTIINKRCHPAIAKIIGDLNSRPPEDRLPYQRHKQSAGGHVHGFARKAGGWTCIADFRYWPSLGCGAEAAAAESNDSTTITGRQQDSRTGQGGLYTPPLSVPFGQMRGTGHEQDTEQDNFKHEIPANRTRTGQRTGQRTGHLTALHGEREQDNEQDTSAAVTAA